MGELVYQPMYINGAFQHWQGDAWLDVVNPATEVLIARVPDAGEQEVQRAVAAAQRAQPGWEALPAIERAGWLRKIASGIRQRAADIAAIIVAEGGKTQALAEVEVAFTDRKSVV